MHLQAFKFKGLNFTHLCKKKKQRVCKYQDYLTYWSQKHLRQTRDELLEKCARASQIVDMCQSVHILDLFFSRLRNETLEMISIVNQEITANEWLEDGWLFL